MRDCERLTSPALLLCQKWQIQMLMGARDPQPRALGCKENGYLPKPCAPSCRASDALLVLGLRSPAGTGLSGFHAVPMKERAQGCFFFFFLETANPPSCNKTRGGRSLFLPPFGQPACSAGFLQSDAMWELAAHLQS